MRLTLFDAMRCITEDYLQYCQPLYTQVPYPDNFLEIRFQDAYHIPVEIKFWISLDMSLGERDHALFKHEVEEGERQWPKTHLQAACCLPWWNLVAMCCNLISWQIRRIAYRKNAETTCNHNETNCLIFLPSNNQNLCYNWWQPLLNWDI